MFGAPKSEQFNDVYFSEQDGLAESRHVFLQGNNLPEGWMGKDEFVIAETGFGTGLNFLAAWKCFRENADAGQKLHFISFEKYPLDGEEILANLYHWSDEFKGYLEPMVEAYPMLVPGFHRVELGDGVLLTLIFDDVNEAMPQVDAKVDAWFLDGFKPSSNPEMWSEVLFQNMARLSKEGARFATFTAAGAVRRGLAEQGFIVEKVQGFGRKRDMSVGFFKATPKPEPEKGTQ
ncbi:MAG: tRNA (5-methylaminomethyl-2-thiouridine)(34)-methyltransferase MnmD [Micavibrio sp.]|nr:tRNA (5-methylaminomethyl-2-thiouridine)(34)-methyltransferase MnmD [Micavibrio sp.]